MNTELTTLLHERAQRVPAAMHPAADLRRQAERHRRVRRAGAVAAATSAVLVITLAGFLSQAGDRDAAPLPAEPTPSVSPSESPSVSPDAALVLVTTIPASFRFAEEESGPEWRETYDVNVVKRSNDRVKPWAVDPCNPTGAPSDERRTAMRTVHRGGPEYFEDLQLGLYADAATAASVLAELKDALDRCRDTSPEAGTRLTWTSEDFDIGDGGVIANVLQEADSSQTPSRQHVAAYRTGNAIFMRTSWLFDLQPPDEPDPAARRDKVMASAEQNLARVCELVRCETPTATAKAEAPLLTVAEISAALGGCCERLHATQPKAGTGHCLTSPLTTASSPVPARSMAAADNVSLVATETAYAADPTTVTDLLAGVYTACRQQSGITTAFDQSATSVPGGHLVGIYLPATGVGVMSGGPEQEYAGWAPAGTGTVLVQIVLKGNGDVSPDQLQRLLAAAVSRATS